ncbi:Zn-dependent hydrolase, glyoxylase [Caldisphaera lagunensis DSM 15908]|uniref:Zn-dependent hydrolase, glyoxylase n=1 Tax=Caldisphaera lagunensis (strain DSM 15908 / JCM 11604 / ANMR 0165 / IC-154) TaxID=1056495 RepID=L0AB35_CALLD|nr:MBL fold metallo-hydrolase [Caldisphaera lagunensis]AFZ70357.1 Zn-dependent hydrolase, glyoxylase [Caldisphaera lagunensis DSM 15908]
MGLENIKGNTFLYKGSPATLFYKDEENNVYIIDPGQGSKRPKELKSMLNKLNPKKSIAFITHYHSDHIAVLGEGFSVNEIVVSEIDAPAVRDPSLRALLTFGYMLNHEDNILPFKAKAINPTKLIGKDQNTYGPLQLIPLPGHTQGQLGVITPDGVLYAADSLFGDKVLTKYGIPYHQYPCKSVESLNLILNMLSKVDIIVPSHGPIVNSSEASQLIESNIKKITEIEEEIKKLLVEPMCLSSITQKLTSIYKSEEPSIGAYLLAENTIRGYISCLRQQGLIEAINDNNIKWKITK